MSEDAADPGSAAGTELEASPEHLYFLAVEKVFIELRGAPLALSPADWHVARKWYEDGVPFEWVERTLREIFAKREAKGTVDKILNLRFCKRSVDAAWKRQQTLLATAAADEPPETSVEDRLAALAAALPERHREAFADRILALAGSAEVVEEKLQQIDLELLAAAAAALSAEARQTLEADLEKSLATLRRRLPASELRGAEERLREQLLRGQLHLPLLSLFAEEATFE